jgi:uroporphyrinogen-III synthase
MRLVVTRPLEDAKRQATKLAALGHEPVIHPLLEIVFPPLSPLALDGVQALIATSRNALRGLSRNGSFEAAKRLPVYCVGEHTAEFARRYGFSKIVCGKGTAMDLAPLIIRALKPASGALLYLTGETLAFDLEKPLIAAGFAVPRLIVYEARAIGEAGAVQLAERLRGGVDGVILMSPRTASIFVDLIKSFKLEREARAITCYCYSNAIAKPLREIDGLTTAISPHPTEKHMLTLISGAPFRSAVAHLKDALGER